MIYKRLYFFVSIKCVLPPVCTNPNITSGLVFGGHISRIVIAFQVALARLDFLPETWNMGLGKIFYVLYLVIGFIFVWRLVQNIISWYGSGRAARSETNLAEQLLPFFRRVAMIILSLIGIIMLFGYLGVDVSAFVATLGVGSLAIALAAQAVLTDTISGFAIMIDRPFRIGDRIEIQELDTWGDVVDIGLRSSRIRTRDNRMVIVPNSVMSQSLIVNYTYPSTQYRIQVHVSNSKKHLRNKVQLFSYLNVSVGSGFASSVKCTTPLVFNPNSTSVRVKGKYTPYGAV